MWEKRGTVVWCRKGRRSGVNKDLDFTKELQLENKTNVP